jgi:dipeptidyl aminopeptidase/acylaminoacyl peptidase
MTEEEQGEAGRHWPPRFVAVFLACAFLASARAADEKPYPIQALFRGAQYSQMALSPDGQQLAALAPVGGRINLVVMDLDKRGATPVTGMTTRDIVWFTWLNNKRLLVRTGTFGTRALEARGGGLFAIDRDGSEGRQLGEGSDEQMKAGFRAVIRPLSFVRALPRETDDFIAQEVTIDWQRAVPGPLFRINSRTGRRSNISLGQPDTGGSESWVVDRDGVARALTVSSGNRIRIHYRAGPDAPWRKLDEFALGAPGSWQPLAIADDGASLYATSYRDGRDKAAIVRYKPDDNTFGEVVAENSLVDVRRLVQEKEGVLGAAYEADKGGTIWFDESLAAIQRTVDKAFPDSVNLLAPAADHQRVLVTSYSDVSPGAFYLFDRKAAKLEWLADRMPWIDAKRLSPMTPVRYPARDGLEIPAYLTVPKGSSGKAMPMVVMVHGGPWVSGDQWSFNPEVQFLASRGYAVLQLNFRGTTRYGWKHFSSSFKQWGLAMQDDVTDGVRWAIDKGVADPNRICIYGASYGGYAAMMGLAKTPELFKCGINYVGVTDLPFFLTVSWSDYAYSDFISYGAKVMVGDIDRDGEQLKRTSPVELADSIRAPVLMAYGSEDRRVPIDHGTRMKSALDRSGKKYQWMVGEGEGHGFLDMKNKVMFYSAMERFLRENIGAK